jgi:hypothetical protein
MVTLGGTNKFYSRNSNGKYPLDVDEIRTAVLATESQTERIKSFIQDRIAKIVAQETSVPLCSTQCLVLHVIPLRPFLNDSRLDLSGDPYTTMGAFQPFRCGGRGHHNLDGFISYGLSMTALR